ncbi:MAG: PorV/PorQ family protein [Bacteroides sp.]|jgi:hypothetical protein|nr:PorV/PorQ family protein [Bacteroides sp.]
MEVRRILFFFSLLSLLAFGSQAQAPKYSNEFLSIGVGARALGLSNAFTALANDATAGYWNPAGLTRIQSNLQLSLMHTQYFAGIARYDYGALAFRSGDNNHFAVSFIRFGVDDIPDTSELIDAEGNINYDRIRSFSASDNAVFFSYARLFPNIENLRIGANAKIIRRTAGSFAGAWGFGLDIGLQYQWKDWHFAAVGRDITSTFNAWSYDFDEQMREVFTLTGNEIPESSLEVTLPRIVLGAARQFSFYQDFGLQASLDMVITTDGRRNVMIKGDPFSLDPSLGLELSYKNLVFLRTGLGNYQRYTRNDETTRGSMQFNMGLGINLGERLSIDYALTDVGDQSVALYSNIFSLRFNIDRRERNETAE